MRQPEATPHDVQIERTDGLLSISLNRPQRANALDPATVEALIEALASADGVRACVIRGQGKNFCAGFDLSQLDQLSDGDLLLRFLRIETLLQNVHHAPFPILALAHGNVIGAGADLFAACWARVAAPGARFAMPGWNFELALGTRRLVARVGTDAARDLLIDTKTIDATWAAEIGLASEVQEVSAWPAVVERFAQRANVLSARASKDLAVLTLTDTRSEDIAAIVATAGRPGLKARVARHVERVAQARAKRNVS